MEGDYEELDAPALPNAWWCAGIGRSARQQEHSLKHGLYTREAIEERRQLRTLMRQFSNSDGLNGRDSSGRTK